MAIYNAIMAFTNWMWTFPILALLIGGGLVITVACDFVQIKHFGYMLKATFGDAAHSKSEEGISSWSAMVATLANTIGTGNIIGVGSAIALGGPGAVFWMWVIGFVAMALKYSEALLGVYTREKDASGRYVAHLRCGLSLYASVGATVQRHTEIRFRPVRCIRPTGPQRERNHTKGDDRYL